MSEEKKMNSDVGRAHKKRILPKFGDCNPKEIKSNTNEDEQISKTHQSLRYSQLWTVRTVIENITSYKLFFELFSDC